MSFDLEMNNISTLRILFLEKSLFESGQGQKIRNFKLHKGIYFNHYPNCNTLFMTWEYCHNDSVMIQGVVQKLCLHKGVGRWFIKCQLY